MMRQILVVMLKEPRPGRVKTRLGREIGMTAAAWWFRHQTAHLLRRVEDPRWHLVLAVSPDAEGMASRVWPAHLPRVAQGAGDLGDRMARLFRSLPPGPVCIIGADIPGITPAHVARAFAALGAHDAVIGPAPDGGYWLIGMKRRPRVREIFEGVRWSSEHAMEDTLKNIRRQKMSVTTLERLRDVDTGADLARWRAA